MMDDRHDRIEEQAVGWLVRLRDPAFDAWDAFTAWLEADAAHAEAYDAAALADDGLDEIFATPVPVVVPVRRRAALGWIGGALAASLVAVTSWSILSTSPYGIETRPGEVRTIALADGSRIILNGGTRVTLDHDNPRIATLDRGEALFTVVHDDSDPFVVRTGGAVLKDVGTVFNVVRDGGVTRVAVAEGAVIYNPDAEAVRLDPGETLSAVDGETQVTIGSAAPAAIGGWHEGRLAYDAAPLSTVAADLSRALGLPIRAAPEVAAMPFTGTIAIDGDRAAVVERLGPLLDVEVRRGQQGLVLASRNRAKP